MAAVFNYFGYMELNGVEISDSDSNGTLGGGAINSWGGEFYMRNSRVLNNTSVLNGGGLFIRTPEEMQLEYNEIAYNSAPNAAALDFDGAPSVNTYMNYNCIYNNNMTVAPSAAVSVNMPPQLNAGYNWWDDNVSINANVDADPEVVTPPLDCTNALDWQQVLATPTPTASPTLIPTSAPSTYPIGAGLPVPIITNPLAYGDGICTEGSIADRPDCAIQAYNAAYSTFQINGVLSWERFIALTIQGEGSILYQIPGLAPADLQCTYTNTSDSTCEQVRGLFQRAMMRQIYEVCGVDNSCSEDEFVALLSGWPQTSNNPPNPIFGIEVWYNAGRANGQANLSKFGTSQQVDNFIPNAQTILSDSSLLGGCGSFACSWGNPAVQPPPPSEYASYIDPNADYGVFNGRVYFIIGAQ